MSDTIITLALCWIVGTVAYIAGRNDGRSLACDERDAAGRHVLQRVTLVGDVAPEMRLMIDNHNRIIQHLCNR